MCSGGGHENREGAGRQLVRLEERDFIFTGTQMMSVAVDRISHRLHIPEACTARAMIILQYREETDAAKVKMTKIMEGG